MALNQHPALEQLQALIARDDLHVSDEQKWRTGQIDPATVRDAAVLILFGVLDGIPAKAETGTPGVQTVGADLDVLIVVRAATLRQHAGQPAFPGGKIDPEDYDLAEQKDLPVAHVAALREAVEETGLDPAGVEILGSLNTMPLPVSNFMVTPVLAWWNATSQVQAQDSRESSLVLRVPVADLLDPARRHTAQVRKGKLTHNSPAFTVTPDNPDEEVIIWGFTGIILSQLFDELGWTLPWNRDDKRPAPGYTR